MASKATVIWPDWSVGALSLLEGAQTGNVATGLVVGAGTNAFPKAALGLGVTTMLADIVGSLSQMTSLPTTPAAIEPATTRVPATTPTTTLTNSAAVAAATTDDPDEAMTEEAAAAAAAVEAAIAVPWAPTDAAAAAVAPELAAVFWTDCTIISLDTCLFRCPRSCGECG